MRKSEIEYGMGTHVHCPYCHEVIGINDTASRMPGGVSCISCQRTFLAVDPDGFEWWEGDYEKQHYDIRRVETGEILKHAWPNAGKMAVGMLMFKPGEVLVRVSPDHPMDYT